MHDPFAPEPIEFRRLRAPGDVLSDSLAFMRDHFVDIGRSLLYIAGPPFLVVAVAGFFLQDEAAAANPLLNPDAIFDPEAAAVPFGLAYFLLMLFSSVTVLLAQGVGFAYAILHVEGTQHPTVAEVWDATKRTLFTLFFYPIGLYLLVVLSMVALFVPFALLNSSAGWIVGLLAFAWLLALVYAVPIMWVMFPARLVGGPGFFSSLRRARALVEGYWWQTFWLIVLVVVLCIVAAIAVSVPTVVLGGVLGLHGGGEVGFVSRLVLSVSGLIGGLSYLLYVFLGVSSTMHYFNLVTKHEGAAVPDLEQRIDAIGQSEDRGWDDDGWDEEADAVRRW